MKLILLGKGAVGKASLIYRFMNYKLDEYDPTIEVQYKTSKIFDHNKYNIEILDTGDDEEYPEIMNHGYILVIILY